MIKVKQFLVVAALSALGLVIVRFSSGSALAQTESPSSTQGLVYETPDRSTEIENELILYRNLIKEYQTAEDKFTFSKSQYQQLGTLASLEELVVSSRAAMVALDRVLISHLKLIRLYLIETLGIDLGVKQTTVGEIEQLMTDMTNHQQASSLVLTQVEVDQQADSYLQLRSRATLLQAKVEQQVMVGRLQAAYDKVKVVESEVEQAVAEAQISKSKYEEKQRALDLVSDRQASVERVLSDFNTLIISPELAKNNRGDKQLTEINPVNLLMVYADISQILTYLDEIVRDI